MDNMNRSPQRYGGVLMTDQLGPDEGVMLMHVAPAPDEPDSFELDGNVILAALHLRTGPSGLLFDISSTPSVSDGTGKSLSRLDNCRLPETTLAILERIRSHLRFRTERGPGVAPAIADQVRFFVFAKGDAPVTLDWRVQFAGKTYPLQNPAPAR